jgi:hypothetical protein
LDFGKVRQGPYLPLKLGYKLNGSEALPFTIKNPIAGLAIQGLKGQNLLPGQQELTLSIPTDSYDGAVDERFILQVHLAIIWTRKMQQLSG